MHALLIKLRQCSSYVAGTVIALFEASCIASLLSSGSMMSYPLLKGSMGIGLSTWPLLLTTPFDLGSGGFGPSGVLDHNSLYATAGRAPGSLSLGGFGAAATDHGDLQVCN